jgi:serine/threonine protein kinase
MFTKLSRLIYFFHTVFIYLILLVFNKKKASAWLFKHFEKLGGIYIKFLQLLALNQNTLSIENPDSLQDMLAVYDHVAFEKIDIINFLKSELGSKISQLKLDSLSPFAAGSFAQVYSASLNGQSVVLKVLRPSVVRFLHFDLNLLSSVVYLISLPKINDIIDFVSVFKDFKKITLEEINYPNEVKNALAFYQKMLNHPVIRIPKTYADFCTNNLIVQEKVEGLPLTKVFSIDVANKSDYLLMNLNTDLNYVMEELAVELFSGSLKNDGSHGDPHPGNIYILPNNQIALIDFGIGSSIQKHQSELLQMISQYAAVYRGEFNPEKICQTMISYYAPYLTKSLQTVSSYFGKQDLVSKILKEIGISAAQTINQQGSDPLVISTMGQFNLMKLFNKVVNKNNRFAIKISFESPELMRSSQIFMKIIRLLDLDMQLLRRSWERVINETNISQSSQAIAEFDNESIDNSFHTLAVWLDKLHYSDPNLYNRVMQNWEVSV